MVLEVQPNVDLNFICKIENNKFQLMDITLNICEFLWVFHKALFLDHYYFLFPSMIWTLILNTARFIILLMIRISYILMTQSEH